MKWSSHFLLLFPHLDYFRLPLQKQFCQAQKTTDLSFVKLIRIHTRNHRYYRHQVLRHRCHYYLQQDQWHFYNSPPYNLFQDLVPEGFQKKKEGNMVYIIKHCIIFGKLTMTNEQCNNN